ncbi:uncharacterized protein LOC133848275 [Drosophila sulfurigaster albostrigata]|uniref:uncharacterized protein LOC133848275 n=1 Tax=Drosophila sulfurigaster albostrigata TaxID=89887 RepID=UPI002D21D931|nr:uncharacterized protein LOC133848275 [Drosophila sulfurigaster albostrigata]
MCSHRVARIIFCQLLLLLGLLILSSTVEARWTVRPRHPTTMRTTTAQPVDRHQHVHHWPPLVAPKLPDSQPAEDESIRVIDNFDQRFPDGQHEYRYQLSNGDTRYERTYWLPVGKNWVLARRGYYSVPLPNAKYSTVFYRADHHGYHVDTHTLSEEQPLLPRTLELPHDLAEAAEAAAAKRNSISVPERNETATAKMAIEEGEATRSESSAKVQAKVQKQQRNQLKLKQKEKQTETATATETEMENKTKPSTVAKVDDILATEVEPTAADDDDDDDALVVPDDDDDDDVTESTTTRRGR